MDESYIRWFDQVANVDVDQVGGKNTSLSEMIQHLGERDIQVPIGFATTADAYRLFLRVNDLDDRIAVRSTNSTTVPTSPSPKICPPDTPPNDPPPCVSAANDPRRFAGRSNGY